MYLVIAIASALGGALLGAGLYLVWRGDFPAWWQNWMLWPLRTVTPRVTHLQGWAGVALGISILAIGFTPIVPEDIGGVLVLAAMATYVAGVVLFLYSTYISRRAAS